MSLFERFTQRLASDKTIHTPVRQPSLFTLHLEDNSQTQPGDQPLIIGEQTVIIGSMDQSYVTVCPIDKHQIRISYRTKSDKKRPHFGEGVWNFSSDDPAAIPSLTANGLKFMRHEFGLEFDPRLRQINFLRGAIIFNGG